MPARREGQLEKCIDEATRKHDFHGLEQFLATDFSDGLSHKCSKQFLNKLDKLICKELVNEEIKNVSTLLNTLYKHGRNINILGDIGFPGMIEYGLVQKMANWFEKAKEILENKENEKNDKFTILFEDFFDVLMAVHNSSSEGKMQILENFIWRTCTLAADKRINIYIQQEAVRKLNTMLDAMPRDTRKKIISTKEILHAMNDMGKRILDAGDYDLQVAITEALCRMTSEKQREELASQWFPMEFVTNAFKGIKDIEFETDCRKFLNQVNGMLGDKRRVFTYPCLSAILDKHELQIPADDNLEEFWIDFNTGSRSISFYVAADDEGHQWETVCIPEEEVATYIIEEKDSKLLTIHLCNPMSVGVQEGEKIILHFDSALEILDAVRKVYGATKCQGFTKKNTISVAKTTVHVIFDESGSQVFVPESQMSPLKEKVVGKGNDSVHQYSGIQADLIQKANKEDFQPVQSKITPSKRKMSEASMIVPSTSRLYMQSPLPLVNTSTPRKCRIKTPLQMMSSVESNDIFSVPERRIMNFGPEDNVPICSTTKSLKKNSSVEKQVQVEKVINMRHSEEDMDTKKKQQIAELIDIVPDSPPVNKNCKQLLPGMEENSVSEIKTQKRQMCSVPETIISHCNKHNISAQETSNLSDRVAKQKAFSSIFEMSSAEVKSKLHCSGGIVEQQHNETNTIPVKNGKIYSTELQNSFNPLDQKISKSSRKNLVSSKPEVSVHTTQMNDSSLIPLGYPKSATATSDDAEFDVYSREKTANKKTNPKAKSKAGVEAAELLISNISDRYKEKDLAKSTRELNQSFSKKSTSLNKSGFSVSKKKNQNRSSGDLKTTTFLNITTKHLMDDVYNFNISGFDEPTIKLGIQEFHLTKLEATKLEATTDLSKKINHENQGKTISRKKQYNKNRTNKNKKHLFSDTDTEYRGDDTKTDISWIRESNRKPKPHLVDYSRMKKQKKSKVLEAKKASPSMSVRRTFQQTEIINNMMPISKNQSDSDRGKQAQPTRLKQKRKAALVKKSYKELSDSETDSEEESSEHLLKRGTLKYPEPKNIKKKAAHKLKENQSIVSSETTKGILINQPKRSSKSKDSGLKRQMDLSSLSSFENPASPEILRCCEKYGLEQSTEEHISPGRSSLSSLLTPEKELISEKEKSLDDIKNMSGIAEINNESIQLKQLSEKGRKLVFGIEDLSPVSSSFSLPNLSSLTTRKKNTSNQDADITKLEEKTYDTNEATSTKHYPLNKSSDIELKDFSENPMGSRGEAPTSVSQSSTPSKEELCHEELLAHIHESGPTVHSNFKRLYQEETEADSDEEEIRREKMKTKLLPRKLFKTDENTYKVSESISTLSINDTTGFDGEGWDADSSSVGMICQKVHQELARKIQSRTKRMDSFTKQSLKTTYQHMNTMNSELHKQRAKQLENLHSCLVKEIESFERDSQALRNMEKDFSNFSKKQSETFRTYNKNEQQRLQNLKISFEKNIYDTADCEETFFTSKMHQMKADMKGIQERFLKEMHEEELLNVRKGLQSLFMDENRNF